jgi:hypothetical protein
MELQTTQALIIGWAAGAVFAAINALALAITKWRRPRNPKHTIEKMQIEVSADTKPALDAFQHLCDEVARLREEMQLEMAGMAKVSLAEGDALIISSPRPISNEQRAAMYAYAEKRLPEGVKVLILDDDMGVGVVTKAQGKSQ